MKIDPSPEEHTGDFENVGVEILSLRRLEGSD